ASLRGDRGEFAVRPYQNSEYNSFRLAPVVQLRDVYQKIQASVFAHGSAKRKGARAGTTY
ncbi:MAG TPA: hypothetical protein VF772_10560, partial [Terriglobales bacterium]